MEAPRKAQFCLVKVRVMNRTRITPTRFTERMNLRPLVPAAGQQRLRRYAPEKGPVNTAAIIRI